jgi:putative redox protein
MKHATLHYVHGLQFVGSSSSGHAIVMDADTEVGGDNTAPRPMDLLLVGIGGCSGMDIVSILKKKKQDITGIEIIVKGEQADTYPKKFTDIALEFIIKGKGISEEAVKRSIELSMNKYCSVKASLEGSAKVRFSYKIIQE